MDSSVVISIENLTKHFGQLTAVDHISLDVRQGDIFGFLGPNGAGKTTTIGMLLGLITPTSGSGHILGFSILSDQEKIKPKIGAIIENPSFYPYLTAEENLMVMSFAGKEKPNNARIQHLLKLVGLSDRKKTPFKAYSLGMKQRLGLACVLLSEPEIIFLDEPTNGLDPAGQKEIRNLILNLAEEQHKTIFISSHQLNDIEKICNRVAIIQKGKIIETGNTVELLATQDGSLFQVSDVELALNVLSSNHFVVSRSNERQFNLFIQEPKEKMAVIIRHLLDSQVFIYAIEPKKRSLEDLFLELTATKG